jgi:hypothetical protein
MDNGFGDERWREMTLARETAFRWMPAMIPESSASLYTGTAEGGDSLPRGAGE